MIKIFPVEKTKVDFYNRNFTNSDSLNYIDWDGNIFDAFVNQLKINRVYFNNIEKGCTTGEDIKLYFNYNPDYNFYKILTKKLINQHTKTIKYSHDLCLKFQKIKPDFIETFTWDYEFLNDTDNQYNSYQRYAVVLLFNNQYYGHIYCWKSDDTCFCIGIRTRVDRIFIEDSPKNISYYLLEGVRTFAKINNCEKMAVVSPLGIMPKILRTLNFNKIVFNNNEDKLFEETGLYCEINTTDNKFIDNHIQFIT